MTPELKNFIERPEVKSLIASSEWSKAYYLCAPDLTPQFTELLFEINIDPMTSWTKIPANYAARTSLFGNTLTIPDNIEVIGAKAFTFCPNIKQIDFGSNVKEICFDAFTGCPLKTLIIPGRIEVVGASAFSQMEHLNKITVEEGVKYIGQYAFSYGFNLTEVELPKSIIELGIGVFNDCPKFEKIIYAGTARDWDLMGPTRPLWRHNSKKTIECADGRFRLTSRGEIIK